ncbi:hypothetical protein IGI04_020561, partial [Brassica rapa subsp. trilocularis]
DLHSSSGPFLPFSCCIPVKPPAPGTLDIRFLGCSLPFAVYYDPFLPRLGVTQSYRRLYSYPAIFIGCYGPASPPFLNATAAAFPILPTSSSTAMRIGWVPDMVLRYLGEEEEALDLRFVVYAGYTPRNREAGGLALAIGDLGYAGGDRRWRFLDRLAAAAALGSRRASLGECLMDLHSSSGPFLPFSCCIPVKPPAPGTLDIRFLGCSLPFAVYYDPFLPRLGVTQSYRRLYSYPAIFIGCYGPASPPFLNATAAAFPILPTSSSTAMRIGWVPDLVLRYLGEEEEALDLRFVVYAGYTPRNREAGGLALAIGDLGYAGGDRRWRFLDGLAAAAALGSRRASLGECLM